MTHNVFLIAASVVYLTLLNMGQSLDNTEPARQLLEVARNELEFLLEQKSAINRKVKVVKRTVEGLITLFDHSNRPTNPAVGTQPFLPTKLRMAAATAFVPHRTAEHCTLRDKNLRSRTAGPFDFRGPKLGKPKLQRACRIALMESDDPATAGEIYDRIIRRGSYQLKMYKHPLVKIIESLNLLVGQGQARELLKTDFKQWQWCLREKELRGAGEESYSTDGA